MAAQPAPSPSTKYSKLSELYLALWKQLDLASNGAKWLEVCPESASALSEEVGELFGALKRDLSGGDLNTALKDLEKTKELLFSGVHQDIGESANFREYLRDLALRYAELADEGR